MTRKDVDDAVARIAARQHGLITLDQALEATLSRSAVQRRAASGRWERVDTGVYLVAGAPFTAVGRLLALCLATGGVASHRSAAALLGADGYRLAVPEITVARGARFTRDGCRIHQCGDLDLAQIVRIQGVPVTDPTRLCVDLGSVVSFDRYEDVVDQLIRERRTDWTQLLDALVAHAARGRNGVGALRALLDERYGEAVPESRLERLFLTLVRAAGLPEPTPQWEIVDADGFVARVDFAYPEAKVAIELDSKKHHLHATAFEADPRKRNRAVLAGWTVLAFTFRAVTMETTRVVREVSRALSLPNF